MKTLSHVSLFILAVTVLFSCKKEEVNPASPVTHSVGETYEGGIVFSVDASGQHGLVSALADQGYHISWSTANSNCNAYSAGTTGGWRLPTKTELELMKTHKATIGGFKNMDYWSSTMSTTGTSAWASYFGTNTGGFTMSNWKQLSNCTICVRAVKAF